MSRSRRNTRRVRDLWWQGVPPSVRGKVWSLAIGNELNITPGDYGNGCTPHIWFVLLVFGPLALCNINLTHTQRKHRLCPDELCLQGSSCCFCHINCVCVCVLELYEIFLSRAKEKWRSFSETSSVNENEGLCLLTLSSHLYLVLYTKQIVLKQLYSAKQENSDSMLRTELKAALKRW